MAAKVREKIVAIERLGAPPISVMVSGEGTHSKDHHAHEQDSQMILDVGKECYPSSPSSENPSLSKTFNGLPEVSYKNTLQKNNSGAGTSLATEEWPLEDGDVIIDKNEIIPQVTFSQRAHDLLAENMRLTVIVRLMGRAIGYRSLHFQIMRLWKPTGVFNLIELGNNFYMIRFMSSEDYLHALTQGPWPLFGSYLAVQPWSPEFTTESSTIKSIVAWIRLPNLPIQLYHKGILQEIAGAIGKVYKVDHNTASLERGKYARYAVGLDLTKPLLPFLFIDGREQRIEYVGLPTICFHCGNYGHLQTSCPKITTQSNLEKLHKEIEIQGMTSVATIPVMHSTPAAGSEAKVTPKETETSAVYGPWLHVPARGKRSAVGNRSVQVMGNSRQGGQNREGNGSRFEALVLEDVSQRNKTKEINDGQLLQSQDMSRFVENKKENGRRNNKKLKSLISLEHL